MIAGLGFIDWFTSVKPLLLFVIGIVLYSIFIFKFYQFLAMKDIFMLGKRVLPRHGFGFIKTIFRYFVEYFVLMPLCVFLLFLTLALFIMFLARERDPGGVLLVAMGIVASIRITAYYNEELAKDLAKMIPLTLLGIFIIDASYFNNSIIFEFSGSIIELLKISLYYLIFTVGMEMILRVILKLYNVSKKRTAP